MELIIIYGPPGVGKLAVAKELSKITGYRVFHNHLTIEVASAIWDFDDPNYLRFRDKYRKVMISDAQRTGVKGIIFTYAYGNTAYEDAFLKDIVRIARKGGGRSLFVQLYCDIKKLRGRVLHPSRKKYQKISTVKELHAEIRKRRVFAKVGFAQSMSIDNTRISPKSAAMMITRQYGLRK